MNTAQKVTFITRHYPPSPNINGEAVCDMVQYLAQEYGIESTIITMDRAFEGKGGAHRQPEGHVIKLKPIFNRSNKLFRFISLLYDGIALTLKAKKQGDGLIVVTTSPPLLPFWASIFFTRKTHWAFWSLDLFPEGFMATKMIGEKNPIYKWLIKKTYSSHPKHLISLGPKQAEHLRGLFRQEIPTSILPCGVFFYQDKSEVKPSWYDSEKIILGYCGNVHDPHNPEFIERVIDNIDPQSQLLVLALYGTKAERVKTYARGKNGIIIVDSVPRNQLHFIDIHLVSLTAGWTHLAVPSKAVSAITMGCPILFCGSPNSDNWHMFQKAGWFISEDDNMNQDVKRFFNLLNRKSVEEKKALTIGLYEDLKQSVLRTYQEIAEVSKQKTV
jgi:hypothetical protein